MHYLLVHGSWHGMWCWEKLIPYLCKQGHSVTCFDLPGSGSRFSEIDEVNLELLIDCVENEINKLSEPFCIVAHSFAGLLVARLSEKYAYKIHHTFYLAAWLPREDNSLVDMAVAFNNSNLPSIFIPAENSLWTALDPEGAKELFYHDCSEEDKQFATSRIKPKNKLPDHTPQQAVNPRYSIVKSTYVLCEKDRVVNPKSQLDMATCFGFQDSQIKNIATGHAPFLAKPLELANILGQFKS
ncbi:Alpha/beta hydrolase family protein [Legionella santicrucis]|uniref:Alpha/beta hydrolase family protein n=1 Tax=Legionella santicrucis TaxID=45074 RepID=A0A0W0Y8H7_9GAMM|nr:alpha/beta fold hydrolase [Legionella santicrucis]KTD53257.1 Alpha/beta hydrolase family protein [Legionella santicrucis]